jgi:integrase
MATIERYELASGTTLYRVRYRTPDHRSTQKRGFSTKRDAELFAATVEVAKARGEFVSSSAGRTTVGELGRAWLERQRGHLKPSGFRTHGSVLRTHVAPRWDGKRIADIRFSDVQAWVSELAGKRSAATVVMAHSVLSRILDDAVKDGLLAKNPARGVKLPKRATRRNVYLTAEQLQRLSDESGRYGALVLLLGTAGLRWGEAAALTPADVDFLRRRIDLYRNAVAVGGQIVVGTLKSGEVRTVPLAAFVADELAAACIGKSRDDLIWSTAIGGYLAPPSGNSWLTNAVSRCQRDDPTFPRVTAHALRHTAAPLAISAGANPKVVQRMLGHASAAMTLDVYADLFESDLEAVAESVAKLWPRRAK